MFGSDSTYLHVVNRPASLVAEFPQAISESPEEHFGVEHIFLFMCKKAEEPPADCRFFVAE